MVKKDYITNPTYQSTFLPLLQRTETNIKKLIIDSFLNRKSRTNMVFSITELIKGANNKMPETVFDKPAYINGLIDSSNKMIKKYYVKPMQEYNKVAQLVFDKPELPIPATSPQALYNSFTDTNIQDMWSAKKGSVAVQDYPKRIKQYMEDLSNEQTTTSEKGKKSITLWQKAELDIRHEEQMNKIEKLKSEGVELAYISTHPNCSKRCELFQGKLVSLTEHAKKPQKRINKQDYSDCDVESYRVRKIDDIWVYSLPDIMATETKGGYNNMIISGFNCRHRLIPYEQGVKPVKDFNAKDISKQREVESKIRSLERNIRKLKTDQMVLSQSTNKQDKEKAKELKGKIAELTSTYKEFCEKNGYAWYDYRIKI